MKTITAAAAPLALIAGLVAGLTVGLAGPAQADDRRCAGTIGAASIDGDVVVPQGATCTLTGTRVDGNVKVYGNAKLVAKGVRVGGSIQAENHRNVQVLPRWSNGTASRSVVDGSIQLKQGGGGRLISAWVGSDIQLFSNDGAFEVRRNFVKGNLQCKSNQPRPVGGGNVVQGNKEDQCRGL
jgi:hypothetical protein